MVNDMNGSENKKRKTQAAIQDALIQLCKSEWYYNITVQDICQQAGVNRTTFYRYYDTRDDLLKELESQYVTQLKVLTPFMHSEHMDADFSDQRWKEIFKNELVQVLDFHLRNKDLTIFLLSPSGDPRFQKGIEGSLQDICLQYLKMQNIPIGKYQDYCIYFFIHGYYNTVLNWLQKMDCSKEEIADYLQLFFAGIPWRRR